MRENGGRDPSFPGSGMKRLLIVASMVTSTVMSMVILTAVAARAPAQQLKLGVSQVDITPPVGAPLAGYTTSAMPRACTILCT